MGRRPTTLRKPARWRILQLTFLYYTTTIALLAQGHVVTLAANDTSGAIQFSGNWGLPTIFDWSGVDTPGVGGPNSSVCTMGEASRYTTFEGDSFSFSFRGISARIVLTSRPDHSPFTVNFDGRTFSGDTYSQVVGCGVAWTSPRSSVIGEHTVTCTNHPTSDRIYLELLSVQFDDGSDLPPPAPPSQSPKPSSSKPSTNTATVPTQSKSLSSIAVHPNVPSGSPTGIEPSSETLGPGLSITVLTITAMSQTVLAPSSQESQGPSESHHSSGPNIAAIAVSTALGILLLLVLLALWRRRKNSRQRQTAVHPLTMPTESSAADSVDTVAAPTREKSALSGQSMQPVPHSATHASMRLADEDIDRIALRMHDMIDARVRHRRTDSFSTLGSGGHTTTLPPYFTTSSAT